MNIPLSKRIRQRQHRLVAELQDLIVEAVYRIEENAVLHGGTAIWRCFQGSRFSEDLDFYLKPKANFKERLERELDSVGARLSKFKQTENAIYAKIEKDRIEVSLEIALREFKKPVASGFEKCDGSLIDVFTPSVEELLVEKLNAFKNRKLIRDIYDAYHLSRLVSNESKDYARQVNALLKDLPKPVDEQVLKNLVLAGAVPGFEQMKANLQRRFSR
jgi:predicted nucleotidyltransferase component of viral defense system